jgi:hypothetical protein
MELEPWTSERTCRSAHGAILQDLIRSQNKISIGGEREKDIVLKFADCLMNLVLAISVEIKWDIDFFFLRILTKL